MYSLRWQEHRIKTVFLWKSLRSFSNACYSYELICHLSILSGWNTTYHDRGTPFVVACVGAQAKTMTAFSGHLGQQLVAAAALSTQSYIFNITFRVWSYRLGNSYPQLFLKHSMPMALHTVYRTPGYRSQLRQNRGVLLVNKSENLTMNMLNYSLVSTRYIPSYRLLRLRQPVRISPWLLHGRTCARDLVYQLTLHFKRHLPWPRQPNN